MVRFCLRFILFCLFSITQSNANDITYRGLGSYRDAYHTELLQLIFEQVQPNKYHAKSYSKPIPHQRGFELLNAGKEIDIMIAYATDERIEQYQAIPLPIMKGLSGWRVSLVHKDNIELFKYVYSLEQLQRFIPGLFHTWTDIKIFKANNITVQTGADFIGLFRMLNKKRFDYLPVAILEAEQEAKLYKDKYQLDIIVEPNLLITYPVCFYFYVKKNNHALAKTLNEGFEKIIANGKYEQLFEKHYKGIIKKLFSRNRQVIRLNNPLLPKSVTFDRKELWLHYQYSGNEETTLY